MGRSTEKRKDLEGRSEEDLKTIKKTIKNPDSRTVKKNQGKEIKKKRRENRDMSAVAGGENRDLQIFPEESTKEKRKVNDQTRQLGEIIKKLKDRYLWETPRDRRVQSRGGESEMRRIYP